MKGAVGSAVANGILVGAAYVPYGACHKPTQVGSTPAAAIASMDGVGTPKGAYPAYGVCDRPNIGNIPARCDRITVSIAWFMNSLIARTLLNSIVLGSIAFPPTLSRAALLYAGAGFIPDDGADGSVRCPFRRQR